MPIKIPKPVFDGITAVRDSGLTNMLDRPEVVRLLNANKNFEAAQWVNDHRSEYANGIFAGFAEEENETQKG